MMSLFKAFIGFLPFPFPTKNALIALTLGLSLGAAGAWYMTSKFAEAERADLLERELVKQREAVKRAITQSEALRAVDNEILDQTFEASQGKQIQIQYVYRKVAENEDLKDADRACDYSADTVGLLNVARQPWPAGDLPGMSETPEKPDEKGRPTSSITRREELEAHISCADRYNGLLLRHNALIDWINAQQDLTGN